MTEASDRSGILFVISAPSGTGKSTVTGQLLSMLGGLEFSISFTTRAPRPGERDGREYHFVDRERFEEMRRAEAFLECATVHGEYYGTGLEATRRVLGEGRDVLLDIDVQGASQVRAGPIPGVSVMILPPTFETLARRLRGRGTEGRSEARGRLARARQEAERYADFDYLVINDDLDRAVEEIASIFRAERCRSARLRRRATQILATFPRADPG